MTIRRLILLLTCTAVIFALTGCSSVNPNTITVTMTNPPTAVPAGATASVSATVTNDSRHEGVDWTATCGSTGACGSFSPTHTASGASTTFTAPSDIPDGNTVTIIATSTRNPGKAATTSPTIQFSNTMLVGNYVFEAAGQDITSPAYQVAGVFTADGTGTITGGELTYSDFSVLDTNIPIDSGTYTIGTDGRGTITLVNSTDTTIGVGGTLTLGTVLANSSHALITQFDASATSSGTMDKQTAVDDLTGGFAFAVRGNLDVATAIGGVFNVDSPGVISGAGSVGDIDVFGFISNALTVTGTVTPVADDALGSVTVDLTIGGNATEFIGYIVDDTHIKLIESDTFDITAGQAIGQGADTGTFVDNTFFSGTFVYGISGDSAFGAAAFAAAFSADGTSAGVLTGTSSDQSLGATVTTDTFTGTYAVDTSGSCATTTPPTCTGRTTATTVFDTTSTAGPTLIFYLTGGGNPPLVINTDTFSAGAGIALPQSGPAVDGAYALNFSAVDSAVVDTQGNEVDGTAQITADGSAGTFSGTGDVNVEDASVSPPTFTPDSGEPVSGTFTASASADGRFDVPDFTVGNSTFGTALYVADPTQGFIIENDGLQVALGLFIAAQE
jgi:hypothetical protein